MVGHAGHWVKQAWQLRVLSIAGAWHTLNTQQDPCEEREAVSEG